MSTQSQQYAHLAKTWFDAQFATMTLLAEEHLATCASVAGLNLETAKAAMAASAVASKQWLTAPDPKEWLKLGQSQAGQAFERAQSYGRQVAGLASSAHTRYGLAAGSAPLNSFFKSAYDAGTAPYTSLE